MNQADVEYMLTHSSLNTSDLNGDRQTDLIASPGAILLNRAAAPNRVPTVFAGPDQTYYQPDVRLSGLGSDPDRHWLTYQWTDAAGNLYFHQTPFIQLYELSRGTHTYTLRVNDGQGGIATDAVRFTIADPAI